MRFNRQRISAIARKEFLHIIYDFRTLFIVFMIPVVQLIMFGYAMNLELRHIDLAVLDYSNTTQSRRLIQYFEGSSTFLPFVFNGNVSAIEALFKHRKANAAIIIPADFERRLHKEALTPVQFLIDASDANAATLIRNYINQVLINFNRELVGKNTLPLEIRASVLFNPDLKSSHFFVPGIIAMILIMISALLTSISIAREKETGTMEQILVSPVVPHEIILGKVLPYIVLAFLDGLFILLVGLVIFHVPFYGRWPLLLSLMTIYILTALAMGLLISTCVRSQQVAMMYTIVTTMLPTIMLSGLIFPISSMPSWLQAVTYLVPARYFLLIVRGVMLKGSTLIDLLPPTLSLIVMGLLLLGISIIRFHKTLES